MAKALDDFRDKRFLPDDMDDLRKIASDERLDPAEYRFRTFVNSPQAKFGINEIDAKWGSIDQCRKHLFIAAQGFLSLLAFGDVEGCPTDQSYVAIRPGNGKLVDQRIMENAIGMLQSLDHLYTLLIR